MLEQTKRISSRTSSVLSKVEPDLHTGSATLLRTNTAWSHTTHYITQCGDIFLLPNIAEKLW